MNASTVLPISRALYTLTENATVIKSDVDVSIVANFLESLKPLIAGNFKVLLVFFFFNKSVSNEPKNT